MIGPYPQRITTGPILSYVPSLCTRPRLRPRIREPIRSPLTHPLAKYTCIPSLSMMFGKKSPSAHTQSIQYSSPSTIFFARHQIPPPVRHHTIGNIPGTCVKLFGCWRLLNNDSIPTPIKNAKEYSRIFPLFLTFSSIPHNNCGTSLSCCRILSNTHPYTLALLQNYPLSLPDGSNM